MNMKQFKEPMGALIWIFVLVSIVLFMIILLELWSVIDSSNFYSENCVNFCQDKGWKPVKVDFFTRRDVCACVDEDYNLKVGQDD